MAIMCIFRARDITPADYDEVRRRIGWEENPPPGGLAHFISFNKGGCVEFDVWESRSVFEAFFTTRMAPVLRQLGLDIGKPEIVELHGMAMADATPETLVPRSSDHATLILLESDALA